MASVRRWPVAVLGLMILLGSGPALAEDEEPLYIPLRPAFVANYGGEGRLRYLKAEVTVRAEHKDAADAVRHHMPYIRNNLVFLFSGQTEEELMTQEGKEALRQAALESVRELLVAEVGEAGIRDLYFESFIVQQ